MLNFTNIITTGAPKSTINNYLPAKSSGRIEASIFYYSQHPLLSRLLPAGLFTIQPPPPAVIVGLYPPLPIPYIAPRLLLNIKHKFTKIKKGKPFLSNI